MLTVSTAGLRTLGVALLMALAVVTQLDAVGNRISAGSPISIGEAIIVAILGVAALLMLAPPDPAAPPRAIGSDGARWMAMLMLWAVFAWTMSKHIGEGQSYLIKLATAIGPALCVLVIVDRPRQLHAIMWAMIAAGVVSAVIVLIESRTGTRLVATSLAATTADFDGVARSSGGSDQNPTTAAQMLMTSAALALGLLFARQSRWRMVLAVAVALGAVALALMSARSAILGLGAAVGLVILSFGRSRQFPLILAGAIIAGGVALMFAPPTLFERFAAIGDFGKDQTLYRRITYLRIGADLIGQSPVWGVGPGNFPQYYITDAYRWMPGRELEPRELHNTYLDAATELGLVGFAIFAAVIGHSLMAARRGIAAAMSTPLAQASFAIGIALVALLVACFFMPHKDMRYLWLMLALAVQCGRLSAGERAAA